MKIVCFIYDDIDNPWCGGGGAYRNSEINKILASKHDVICYTGNYPSAGNGTFHGIRFRRLGTGTSHLLSRGTFFVLANLYCAFVTADVIVSAFTVFAPVFAFLFPWKKVVTYFDHYWGKQLLEKYKLVGRPLYFIEQIAIYGSRYLVTGSPSVEHIIHALDPKKEVLTIFSGLDPALLKLEKRGEQHILFLGRMDWYMKGMDVLLSALEKMVAEQVPFKAIIAGKATGKQASFVGEQVRQRGLQDYVEVKPNVDNEKKKELLSTARIFCVPSRFEGWCIASLEAAACMVPVVGTNVPGLKDAVVNGKTGFLVERENAAQLKDKIVQLHLDADLRRSMGAKGRKWARNFKWSEAAAQHENFLERVLGEKGGSKNRVVNGLS